MFKDPKLSLRACKRDSEKFESENFERASKVHMAERAYFQTFKTYLLLKISRGGFLSRYPIPRKKSRG